MATQFEVVIPWGAPTAANAATSALDLIDQIEDQLSVFRPSSELSRLNRTAAHAPVPVEPRLFELLTLCERLSRETDGAFDVTSSPLSRVWGFHDREGKVPDESELSAARERVGMHRLEFDRSRGTIRFPSQGVEINLGSIGKGYALDRAAELLQSKWRQRNFLIEGGASSVLAFGAPPDDDRGWSVGIRHPHDDGRSVQVHLRDRALGVTGIAHQHFSYNGRKLGHVLDPRTGCPCVNWALAIVLAPTAAEADALSTAFFAMSGDATARYCSKRSDIAAILLPTDMPEELKLFNHDEIEFGPAHRMSATHD